MRIIIVGWLVMAATAGADSTLPPAVADAAAVEVSGVPLAGPVKYRVGLVVEDGYGCGQGGHVTTHQMKVELAIAADDRVTLKVEGERREASWSQGRSLPGGKPWHSESRNAIGATLTGKATRRAGGVELDLAGLGDDAVRTRVSCEVVQVPFAEADSATIGVLECKRSGLERSSPVLESLMNGADRWPFGRGAGVYASLSRRRNPDAKTMVSLMPPRSGF